MTKILNCRNCIRGERVGPGGVIASPSAYQDTGPRIKRYCTPAMMRIISKEVSFNGVCEAPLFYEEKQSTQD